MLQAKEDRPQDHPVEKEAEEGFVTNSYSIELPNELLSSHIKFLKETTLIGKFWDQNLQLFDIMEWENKMWIGVKTISFLDSHSKYLIVLFDSKSNRDEVHKHKGWFCMGSGLFTLPCVPNFKPIQIYVNSRLSGYHFQTYPLNTDTLILLKL